MAKIDSLVQDFLAQKKIAVVGVSDKRDTGCNMAYKKFKDAGYQVYAVNPRITTYEGAPCYPDLKSMPEKPDAVFILANPKVTEAGRPAVRGPGHQARLDALHDGYQARPGGGHDQRLGRSSASVPGERDRRHPRFLPEPVPEAGFRSWHDARHVAHPGLPARGIAVVCGYPGFEFMAAHWCAAILLPGPLS